MVVKYAGLLWDSLTRMAEWQDSQGHQKIHLTLVVILFELVWESVLPGVQFPTIYLGDQFAHCLYDTSMGINKGTV